jgi:hypothetical protein
LETIKRELAPRGGKCIGDVVNEQSDGRCGILSEEYEFGGEQ